MILVVAGMTIVAIITTVIGYRMYRTSTIEAQREMGIGVTNVLAASFDHDRVDEYLTLGDAAPGYKEAELAMAHVRDSSPDISYVYVYQIQPDGCHVVFDPDKEDEPGSDPGEIMEFDPAFAKEMATHSNIFSWRILWTEEPSGLQSMGSQRVRHD